MKTKIILAFLVSFAQALCTQNGYFSDSIQKIEPYLQQQSHELIVNLPPISPSEIELLANFLYITAQGSYFEATIRHTIALLYVEACSMQKNIADAQSLFSNATQLAMLLESIKEHLPKRSHALNAWQVILNEIENSGFPTLNTIVNTIHLLGKDSIAEYIAMNNESIMNRINQSHESLAQQCAHLMFCKGALQAISENQNPFVTDYDTNQIASLDAALAMEKQIFKSITQITSDTLKINVIPVELLVITALLFENLYSELQANNHEIFIPSMPFFE